jgi:hypothetical protein
MVQKKPENYFFNDLIRNFMEHGAESHNNFRSVQKVLMFLK